MTQQIATLIGLIQGAQKGANEAEAGEWNGLLDALKPYSEYPLRALTAKLQQVVLKIPAAPTQRKPRTSGTKKPTDGQPTRVKKPKPSESERSAAVEFHIRRLKDAFVDDAAFGAAFDQAKGDPLLDAKSAVKLFEGVVGPINFPINPLRKPTIFKQLREQRNTLAYRRGRTE